MFQIFAGLSARRSNQDYRKRLSWPEMLSPSREFPIMRGGVRVARVTHAFAILQNLLVALVATRPIDTTKLVTVLIMHGLVLKEWPAPHHPLSCECLKRLIFA